MEVMILHLRNRRSSLNKRDFSKRGMIERVTRQSRVATAAALALAVAVLPMVLDRCAESCDAQRAAAVGTPSCHHAGSPAPRVGQVPRPCGHDHHPVIAPAAATTERASRPAVSTPAVAVTGELAPATVLVGAAGSRAGPVASPPCGSLPLALASALRV